MINGLSIDSSFVKELKEKYFYDKRSLGAYALPIDYYNNFHKDYNIIISDYFDKETVEKFKNEKYEYFVVQDWEIASPEYLDQLDNFLENKEFSLFLETNGVDFEELRRDDFFLYGILFENEEVTNVFQISFALDYKNKTYIYSQYTLEGDERTHSSILID